MLYASRLQGSTLPAAALAIGVIGYFLVVVQRLHAAAARNISFQAEKDSLIAELEQAKLNSDEARRRAESANLAKSRFLATMSHELRTPLNAILGFSEVMKGELFGPHGVPAYKEYSNDIHVSGQHLLMLINEILDLSRVEAGRYELKEEPVSLPAVVEDCCRLLAMRAKSRNLDDHRSAGAGSAAHLGGRARGAPGDAEPAHQRDQVHARRAARSWSRSAGRGAGGQYVSIRDTGPGIPPEEIPIVLSSFGRGSLAHKNAEEGTGLGLPIVKGLVELHGGQFRLTSKLRQGTEAIVIFPPERVMDGAGRRSIRTPPRRLGRTPRGACGIGAAGPIAAQAALTPTGCARLLAEARRLDREMDLVLEAGVLALDQERRGVRDRAADGLDPGRLGLGEVAQHEIVDERLVARMADAEADAPVVVADMGGDRAQAVVAGVAAADLDPHLGGREVELVVNARSARPKSSLWNRSASPTLRPDSFMKVCGASSRTRSTPDHAFRDEAGEARAERPEAMRGGDRRERHEADIVTVARVARARIAESRDDEHGAPDSDARRRRTAPSRRSGPGEALTSYFLAAGLAGGRGRGLRGSGRALRGRGGLGVAGRRGGGGAAAAAAAGVSSAMTVGGTMVTTVRSRLGADRLAALRQLEVRDMHRIVEVEAGEVDRDRLGDVVRRRHNLDRVEHEIDRAALLDAGRGLAVLDVDRHGDAHARARRSGAGSRHAPAGR